MEGECAVKGCKRAATHPARGARNAARGTGAMNQMCDGILQGAGAQGMVLSRCERCVAEVGRDRYGRWSLAESLRGSAQGGIRPPKGDKARAAMDRCYEVDIGDMVETDTHNKGTVSARGNNKHAAEGSGRVGWLATNCLIQNSGAAS